MPIPNLGRGGLPIYAPSSSSATILNASRNVAFTGTALVTTDATTGAATYSAAVGDAFVVSGIGATLIESITDATNLVLVEPWNYATQTSTVNWYIIRNPVPAFGYVAKAIQDVLNSGTDTNPIASLTADDGTARIKLSPNAGAPGLLVGPSGGPVVPGVTVTPVGFVSFPNNASGSAGGIRNKVYNPCMNLRQRGTSVAVASGAGFVQTLDRWSVSHNLGSVFTAARVTAPSGFLPVGNALSISGTASNNGSISIQQGFPSETIQDMEGIASMLSFDILAVGGTSGSIFLDVNTVRDDFTTLGINASASFTAATSAARINIPFTAAQMVNARNGARLRVVVAFGSGAASLTFGNVSFSKDTTPHELEFLPLELDLVRCSKYFQSSYNMGVAPGTASVGSASATHRNVDGGTNFSTLTVPFTHHMRAVPTIKLFSPNSGAADTIYDVTANADKSASVTKVSEQGFCAQINNVAVATGNAIQLAWTADAEL